MDDLKGYMPVLMIAGGGFLQWFRQFKSFREEWYYAVAVIIGVLAYLMVTPFDPAHPRLWSLSCLEFLTAKGGLAQIFGGTFLVSNGAKGIAAVNPSAGASVIVPVTNSKGKEVP